MFKKLPFEFTSTPWINIPFKTHALQSVPFCSDRTGSLDPVSHIDIPHNWVTCYYYAKYTLSVSWAFRSALGVEQLFPLCTLLHCLCLAWMELKGNRLAAPVFAQPNLQFTVIKSFNTVIIFLARPVFMVSDMEWAWLTAAWLKQ